MIVEKYRCYKGAWIFSCEPHLERRLSNKDKRSLLVQGGLMIRNVFDFDCKEKTSFWYVIKDSFGGMEDIPSKYRGRVKKALEHFEFKIVDRDYLIYNGYGVYKKAAENYRVKCTPPTKDEFACRISQCEVGYDLWACIDKHTGEMVAFAINHIVGESVDYQTMKFEPDSMRKYHSSYGLIYEMNRYYLDEKKMRFVNDGARSITNHSDVQPFLIDKFNFRKAYCRLELTYKWWFGIAVKVLYPFRRFIQFAKVKAILNMEAMARGEI